MEKIIKNSQAGKLWIEESISKGVERADICSAYIRSEAFQYFFENAFEKNLKIRVLARWTPGDLLTQSSDLATYELCRSHNIDFYIKQDFHGKLYDLAPFGVLVGSFNLTNRGFSISRDGNDEAGVLIDQLLSAQFMSCVMEGEISYKWAQFRTVVPARYIGKCFAVLTNVPMHTVAARNRDF